MITILNKENTVLNDFIAQLRDVTVQTDSLRFRRNLERMGELTAYEISKKLSYEPTKVETPLGELDIMMCSDKVVLATILRAGVPYHQGFLNIFDKAESTFVSTFRKVSKDNSFKINVEYISNCNLEGKTLILVDPLIATGASIVVAYEALVEKGGMPKDIHIATIISSEEGLEFVQKRLPRNTHIWCGAVDEELTVRSFVVPGMGDAGDLAYGAKK
ncbi:MAG: uracil phosphoribosyltransferase [Tidjanibacter sp.]|nr:uracil phosphoribosyltransferase [Tidjanibacter sp.]